MAKVKLSLNIVQKVVSCLRMDWTVEEACRQAKIAKQTHYNRIEKDVWIMDGNGEKIYYKNEVESAMCFASQMARSVWMKAIRDGNVKAAIKFLELRDERYRPKQETIDTTPAINEEDLIDD